MNNPSTVILFYYFKPMDELKEMTLKLVEYHNKIVETSNNEGMISDECATEVSNYLSNEVVPH